MGNVPCSCGGYDVQQLLCEVLDSGTSRARVVEIRQILAQCPECVERLTSEQEIRGIMQRCCGHEHAPSALRERISAQIRIIQR